jgi:hypothetical protein
MVTIALLRPSEAAMSFTFIGVSATSLIICRRTSLASASYRGSHSVSVFALITCVPPFLLYRIKLNINPAKRITFCKIHVEIAAIIDFNINMNVDP